MRSLFPLAPSSLWISGKHWRYALASCITPASLHPQFASENLATKSGFAHVVAWRQDVGSIRSPPCPSAVTTSQGQAFLSVGKLCEAFHSKPRFMLRNVRLCGGVRATFATQLHLSTSPSGRGDVGRALRDAGGLGEVDGRETFARPEHRGI